MKRSRLEMFVDTLVALKDRPLHITGLMHHANLNYNSAVSFINMAINDGLVDPVVDRYDRVTYHLTSEGAKTIDRWKVLFVSLKLRSVRQ